MRITPFRVLSFLILLLLFGPMAFAQGSGGTTAVSSSSAASLSPDEQYALCMMKLVDQRESFVQRSVNGYNNYMQRALRTRKTKIMAAWSITDPDRRQSALNASWRDFGSTWRTANNELKRLRSKAWSDYRVAITQCGTRAMDEEALASGPDSQW
jgi:hypothetical protein